MTTTQRATDSQAGDGSTDTGTSDKPGRTAAPVRRHAVFHPLRVASVDRLTEDSVAITFDVPKELRDEFQFTAGQHLSVKASALGDDVRRNYSICTSATGGALRIGVKRIPEGAFSSYAADLLQPGDVLDVMTPSGTFTAPVDPNNAKRYVAVAAGSGITPVLSILATVLEVEPLSSAALIYVNRRTSTIMFLEEPEDLKNRYPDRFQLVHVLGQEMTDVDMLSGRLDVQRLGRILDTMIPVDDVDEWFLCGPLAMTDSVRGVLLERQVDTAHVHRELFHVGAPVSRRRPTADPGSPVTGSTVTVILDGRSLTFTLPRDGASVLDGTLRTRSDTPYACKNAVCGTCRAKVIEGKVEMDSNYALEPDEIARGYVLTCQSHPVTDQVIVDYDQ
ncbi:MAG: 1,2-phenylacetyl-CoA epoxidase subunit PaaE [Nakamurella sp.]